VRSTQNTEELQQALATERHTSLTGEQQTLQCPPSCGHGSCVWQGAIPLCSCEEGFAGTLCNTTREVDEARKRVQEQFLAAVDSAANFTGVLAPEVYEGYLTIVHSCLTNPA